MSAFWTFTLGIYAKRPVQSALLHLQDDRDADVNLLLYALWSASIGLPPQGSDRIRHLAGLVREWRVTAIEPLRTIRKALGDGVAEAPQDDVGILRSGVLKLEIESERIEQVIIENATPGGRPGKTDRPEASLVASNLAAVVGLSDQVLSAENIRAIETLVEAASSAGGTDVARAMAMFRERPGSTAHAPPPIA